MSKIALTPNSLGSGTFTIASPNSDTDRVLTLPDEAGTVLTSASDLTGLTGIPVTGNIFGAYGSSGTSVGASTYTKIAMNAEFYDPDSCYDTSLYRFTPNVAGYYFFTAQLLFWSGSNTMVGVSILKNGGNNRNSFAGMTAETIDEITVNTSCMHYMNGTTDYVEVYGYAQNPGQLFADGGTDSQGFYGFFLRA